MNCSQTYASGCFNLSIKFQSHIFKRLLAFSTVQFFLKLSFQNSLSHSNFSIFIGNSNFFLFPCLEILQYYNFSDTRDLSSLLYFIDSSPGSDFHHLIPGKMQQTFGLVEGHSDSDFFSNSYYLSLQYHCHGRIVLFRSSCIVLFIEYFCTLIMCMTRAILSYKMLIIAQKH